MAISTNVNDVERAKAFFDRLGERKRAQEDVYARFAPKLAPAFSSFNFIRPNEMRLSEIVASLLNPRGAHAQGDVFLKLFLETVGVRRVFSAEETAHATVGCEVTTDRIENRARRVDIEVAIGNFGIGIENKPWASDQDNQLSDYAHELATKFGATNWCLMYLSGRDTPPSESSVPQSVRQSWEEDGKYHQINYGTVVDWLRQCEAGCAAERVRHFLRDFIFYCESELLGLADTMDVNIVKDFVLQGDNLELAVLVSREMAKIKEHLLKKLLGDLQCEVMHRLPGWELQVPDRFGYWTTKDIPLRLRKPAWRTYSLAIEFGANQCNNIFRGIKKYRKEDRDLPQAMQELRTALNLGGSRSQWWPWWCSYPVRNWQDQASVWISVRDGVMAKELIDDLSAIRTVAEPIIDSAEAAR